MARKRKQLPKTVLCRHCDKRFLAQRRGSGLAKLQVCPFCKLENFPPMSISAWKAKCNSVFSEWIRRRHADSRGIVECVTCGFRCHWDARDERGIPYMQAGHFLDGRSRGILFEERCVHPQCRTCNVVKHGNKDRYWPFMLERYGQAVIDELIRLKNQSGNWGRDELEAIFLLYQSKLKDLERKTR